MARKTWMQAGIVLAIVVVAVVLVWALTGYKNDNGSTQSGVEAELESAGSIEEATENTSDSGEVAGPDVNDTITEGNGTVTENNTSDSDGNKKQSVQGLTVGNSDDPEPSADFSEITGNNTKNQNGAGQSSSDRNTSSQDKSSQNNSDKNNSSQGSSDKNNSGQYSPNENNDTDQNSDNSEQDNNGNSTNESQQGGTQNSTQDQWGPLYSSDGKDTP